MKQADAERLVANRDTAYGSVAELARRAGLARPALERLARADAFGSLGLDRRQAAWAVGGIDGDPLPLFAAAPPPPPTVPPTVPQTVPPTVPPTVPESEIRLPPMGLGEQVAEDYAVTRLSLKRHPVAFVRGRLEADGVVAAAELARLEPGSRVTVAGLVTIRQRPSTAKGIIFVTLEDETGVANIVVRPPVFERHRRPLLAAVLLAATGRIEREGLVIHLIAESLADRTAELRALTEPDTPPPPVIAQSVLEAPSRNFR